MSTSPHYILGDGDVAAQRLVLLAAAFEPSSQAWLQALALPRPACAADLGCGPGLTTALLAQTLAPAALFGIDQSERLLERARARAAGMATAGTQFAAHDLSSAAPLPIPPADVIYARFLLTHLASPGDVLRRWLQALAPRGVLLLEEVADLHSDDPIMTRYYARVAELQAHYGQATYIGRELPALCAAAGGRLAHAREQPIQLPASTMARLHALNIQTWGQDAYALAAWGKDELAALALGLERIAAGAASPPVVCRMAQLQVRLG